MGFADVARELLLVAPADFVAERTARQRAVRKDDRALATAIGGLRKPAPAAWVIDLLAHEGALDEAVDLGPAIRQAQADADPAVIRKLRRQRAGVVDALTQAGADLASDAGHPVTPAVLDQVRATIEAAMADPHAGAAVRSGLLVRALESAGFDDVDLDGALADPDAVPDAWSGSGAAPIPITEGRRAAGTTRASRKPERKPDRERERKPDHKPERKPDSEPDRMPDRERETAPDSSPETDPAAERRAAREAETAARTESRDADAALDAAEDALATAEDRRADLERQLAEATAEVTRLEHARDDAETTSDRARELLAAAQHHRREVGR
ncbi:hypothetical protein BJK06_03875 [Curtobacterium sp. BH-2-1-1]|uniref:hypothetical protein n=1 Tax=Curtobacterium sp. BH-2-1-1 TaxID=1905847 RepID=UPI00089DD811|nr:hypothetical protein [Curtobacterium sp. BH-2-1-1]AOX65018.1 hypothetical protein BJK06_03875 [Curtobacterium sp. BH-2-1-1]